MVLSEQALASRDSEAPERQRVAKQASCADRLRGLRAAGRASKPGAVGVLECDRFQSRSVADGARVPQVLEGFASLVLLLQQEDLLESFAERAGDQRWHKALDE